MSKRHRTPEAEVAPRAEVGPESEAPETAVDEASLQGNAAMQEKLAASGSADDGGGSSLGVYDTSWMDELPEHVRVNIDGKYSLDTAIAKHPEVLAITKLITPLEKQRAKLVKGKKDTTTVDAEIKTLYAQRKEVSARVAPELKEKRVGKLGKDKEKGESTDDRLFTDDELTVGEGTDIVRDNFMGQMVGLLGTPEKVQAYFREIKASSAPGKPWLHRRAGARLEAAHKSFEAQFPGTKFLSSDVAWSMRGRHNMRQGKGMLAHASGMAIDYKAYENPHLKDWQQRVLLETVSGEKSRLELNDKKGDEYGYQKRRALIMKLGKQTAAGEAPGEEEGRLVGAELDQSFDAQASVEVKMRQTLDANGDGAELDKLREIASRYWKQRDTITSAKASLNKAGKTLGAVQKDARGRIGKARTKELDEQIKEAKDAAREAAGGEATRKQVAKDPLVESLVKQRAAMSKNGPSGAEIAGDAKVMAAQAAVDGLKAKIEEQSKPFRDDLEGVLAPWKAKLDERIASLGPALQGFDPANLPTQKLVEEALKVVNTAVAGKQKKNQRLADPAQVIAAVQANPKFAPLFAKAPPDVFTDATKLRTYLVGVLGGVQAAANAKSSIGALEQTRWRLMNDLYFVLGVSGKKTVASPSMLQVLEVGLVMDDKIEDPKAAGGKDAAQEGAEAVLDPKSSQQSYFKEFTRVMMQHGFEAAGAWEEADTMHFELVEGMAELQVSGGGTFGPNGRKGK